MNLKNGIILFVGFLLSISFSSCDHTRNNPGWEYFDDMVKSPAYETYTENPNFKDGKTLQPTVEGTVPRGFIKYPYEKTDSDRVIAGLTLVNPLEATPENIERGKKVYTIYCSNCHGINGDGQGNLFTSGKFQYPPGNLLTEKVRTIPDGEIYHVITVGWGIMAAHGSQVQPDDRWKVVLYIRNELQKD